MMQVHHINHLNQLPDVAAALLPLLDHAPIVAFYGPMGAGKTTFIKAFCKHLGVTDEVNSPTFSLVNEYANAAGDVVYHFDFYRIKHISEAYDIGYENYFYSGYPCLIEWPEKIEQLLPEKHVKVFIEATDNSEQRRFGFELIHEAP
jgi:tRNA threonylcarbamoyladenosine biosynthesis protein TsaE